MRHWGIANVRSARPKERSTDQPAKDATMATLTSLEVSRKDLRSARIVSAPLDVAAAVAAGKAVLAIDRFALTANNITYGAFGDQMSYWGFFPASEGYGHIPVWGFADVLAAPAASGLTIGERVYGYFPMASHLVIEPGQGVAEACCRYGRAPRQVAARVQCL